MRVRSGVGFLGVFVCLTWEQVFDVWWSGVQFCLSRRNVPPPPVPPPTVFMLLLQSPRPLSTLTPPPQLGLENLGGIWEEVERGGRKSQQNIEQA